MEKDNFYKPEELAKELKLNKVTIYRYIKGGKLKALKLGKEYRISREDFEDFLKRAKDRI